MRISFQTKIFLGLVLTVVALLGGTMAVVDRVYAARMKDQIDLRFRQGHRNFHENSVHIWEDLQTRGKNLSESQRIIAGLESPERHKEAGGIARYEVESQHIRTEYLAVADRRGGTLKRFWAPPGARARDEEQVPPLVERAVEPGRECPEAALVRRQVDLGCEEWKPEAGADEVGLFVVDEGRLFQVAVFPLCDGDRFRGVLVLGREVTDKLADRIHKLQAEEDGAGYVVGDRMIASSFAGPARASADAALAAELGGRASTRHVVFDADIGGAPHRAVLDAIHDTGSPRPIYTALFVSLDQLVAFQRRMRTLFLLAAVCGVALSFALSIAIARGVSRPVRDLVQGTERIARGDYAHRVRVRSRDELGDLAGAFNRMAGDLATKEKIRGVLNKVVAKEVAEELLQGDLGLGGRQVRATLLFADLRGFTAMTQGAAPQAVVAMLNEYMTAMSREIFACKGIVDKYVGDEIIGVFGAPKSYGADALGAVEAACRMRACLERLNAERARRGERPLAMGIGIHSGEVVAGCMGSEELLNYTCIGETVNLASRLCSNAKPGQILISAATRQEAGPRVDARPLEPLRVKGFAEPVAVFEVAGVAPAALLKNEA